MAVVWFLLACGPGDFVDGANLSVPSGADVSTTLVIPSRPTLPLPHPSRPSGRFDAWCFARTDGAAVCVGGDDSRGGLWPKAGRYVSAANDGTQGYGVTEDGRLQSWGPEVLDREGPFVLVTGGPSACALAESGAVLCDGREYPGPFAGVTVGSDGFCALTLTGEAECHVDKLKPPPGAFVELALGQGTACGVRTNGALTCWGDNRAHLAEPPEGTFEHVSIGTYAGCAWSTGGDATCWDIDGVVAGPKDVAELAFIDYNLLVAHPDGRVERVGSPRERHPDEVDPAPDSSLTSRIFTTGSFPDDLAWQAFAPEVGLFTARLPGTPKQVDEHTWTLADDPLSYGAFWLPAPGEPEAALDAVVTLLGAMRPTYQVAYVLPTTIRGQPARRVRFRDEFQIEDAMLVMNEGNVVGLTITWPVNGSTGNAEARLFSSLALVPYDAAGAAASRAALPAPAALHAPPREPCDVVASCCAVLEGTSMGSSCKDLQGLLATAPSAEKRTEACERFVSIFANQANAPVACR